jgi:hypothetical protein
VVVLSQHVDLLGSKPRSCLCNSPHVMTPEQTAVEGSCSGRYKSTSKERDCQQECAILLLLKLRSTIIHRSYSRLFAYLIDKCLTASVIVRSAVAKTVTQVSAILFPTEVIQVIHISTHTQMQWNQLTLTTVFELHDHIESSQKKKKAANMKITVVKNVVLCRLLIL